LSHFGHFQIKRKHSRIIIFDNGKARADIAKLRILVETAKLFIANILFLNFSAILAQKIARHFFCKFEI